MSTSKAEKQRAAAAREERAIINERKGRMNIRGGMSTFKFRTEEASEMGARHRKNRVRNQVYMIEGCSVTIFKIAELMGKSTAQAYAKFKRVRDNNPRVTWALLGVKAPK